MLNVLKYESFCKVTQIIVIVGTCIAFCSFQEYITLQNTKL